MARCLVLFFAALIAVSQAAPRPQDVPASQQTGADTGSSSSGGAPSSASNTGSPGPSLGASVTFPGTADPTAPIAIIIPPQFISSLFPSVSASGTSSSSSSSSSNGNPLAAIISLIPAAISSERERIQTAVTNLVDGNVSPIRDSIEKAASTGGQVLSHGVELIGAWPKFFGQLIG